MPVVSVPAMNPIHTVSATTHQATLGSPHYHLTPQANRLDESAPHPPTPRHPRPIDGCKHLHIAGIIPNEDTGKSNSLPCAAVLLRLHGQRPRQQD